MTTKQTGVYLELFHGRKQGEELQDWGEQGPVFGPFDHFHTTYACEIKFDEGDCLPITDEMVYYNGMYYGDWSVFSAEVFNASKSLQLRLTVFDQSLAKVPVIPKPAAVDHIATVFATVEELMRAELTDDYPGLPDALAAAKAQHSTAPTPAIDDTPEGLLRRVQETQTAFWEAISALESEVGFDLDSNVDYEGYSVEDLKDATE